MPIEPGRPLLPPEPSRLERLAARSDLDREQLRAYLAAELERRRQATSPKQPPKGQRGKPARP